MQIEFQLPRGAGGMAAQHYYNKIKRLVEAWAAKHNYTMTATVRIIDHNPYIAISFNDDRAYTLFALEFDSVKNSVPEWRVSGKN